METIKLYIAPTFSIEAFGLVEIITVSTPMTTTNTTSGSTTAGSSGGGGVVLPGGSGDAEVDFSGLL